MSRSKVYEVTRINSDKPYKKTFTDKKKADMFMRSKNNDKYLYKTDVKWRE